jgi:site-specific recombinase XerD
MSRVRIPLPALKAVNYTGTLWSDTEVPMSDSRLERLPLFDAYSDFVLSMKAKRYSKRPYGTTLTSFNRSLRSTPNPPVSNLKSNHLRAYLTEVVERQVSDATMHTHARALKTFKSHLEAEGYVDPIPMEMQKIQPSKNHTYHAKSCARF